MLPHVIVTHAIYLFKTIRQRAETRRNFTHDYFYEVRLVDQVTNELCIEAQRIKRHDNDVVEQVLLALSHEAFSVALIVDQDVERQANVEGYQILRTLGLSICVFVLGGARSSAENYAAATQLVILPLVTPQLLQPLVVQEGILALPRLLILVEKSSVAAAKQQADKMCLIWTRRNLADKGRYELEYIRRVKYYAWPLVQHKLLVRHARVKVTV